MVRRTVHSVGIYPNFAKRRCRKIFKQLVDWLEHKGCAVWVSEELEGDLPPGVQRAAARELARRIHLLVVLGGDGTLLTAARALYPKEVPILGVNFGGLGFLTDVYVKDLFGAMERTLQGDYAIERRMMLEVSILGSNGRRRARLYGLNDAVVHESGHRLIEIGMTIGKARVGVFKADGLIVASPTGSTAYSLSAWGPIVEPLLDALVAVPICAHMLAVRPLIFPASESINIEPRDGGDVYLAVDGQVFLELHAGDVVRVKRAPRSSCFVQLRERCFYELLREKMKWGA